MRRLLRILLFFIGSIYGGWAQCPANVLGTQQIGQMSIRVGSSSATPVVITGTSNTIITVCKGQTLYVEEQTPNANASLASYWFEYTSDTINFTSTKPTGSENVTSHTYSITGTYGLIMSGSSNSSGHYACQTITVIDNPQPDFNIVICAVGEATITIPQSTSNPYDKFTVYWGDNNTETLTQADLPYTKTHTYSDATVGKTVRVTGSYETGCSNWKDVYAAIMSVSSLFQPSITQLEVVSNANAVLQYVGQAGTETEIYQKVNGGTYQATGLKNTTNIVSQTVTGLDNTKQYCFQVKSLNVCATPIPSSELCTIPISITANGKQIDVKWQAHPSPTDGLDFQSYTVTNGITTFPAITDISTTQLSDTTVLCGPTYCYKVTARIGNMTSISMPKCESITLPTTPPLITDFYTTVYNGQARLEWQLPAGQESLSTLIQRAPAGQGFQQLVDRLITSPLQDTTSVATERSYCYKISYRDICKNYSDFSSAVCTIFLRQSGSVLTWTSPTPFTEAVKEYTIHVLDPTGNIMQQQSAGLKNSYSISSLGSFSSSTRFRVEAVTDTGRVSWSNVINYTLPIQLYVQEAFSPNGDTQNDVFHPIANNVDVLTMTIYDRWGNPIFSMNNLEGGWDGTINGKQAPQGDYAYRIEVTNSQGEKFTKRGMVRLVR
ncbi:MAG: gliding motility-associated C-terminal domain-containing protein [Siphonobacter sp.]